MRDDNRIWYIDNTKGFAMIFIFLVHCSIKYYYSFFYEWMHSFIIPIYFLISGILIYNGLDNGRTIDFGKKALRYMIPYVVFSTISLLGVVILKSFGGASVSDYIKEEVVGIIRLNGVGANWFLPVLLISEALFYLEYRRLKVKVYLCCNAVLALGTLYIPNEVYVCRFLSRIVIAVFFISLGYHIFRLIKTKIDMGSISNVKYAICCIVLFVLTFLVVKINGCTNYYEIKTGNYPWVWLLEMVLSSWSILLYFMKFLNKKCILISWIGRNSLFIMGTHQVIIEYIWALNSKMDVLSHTGKLLPFTLAGITLIFEVLIIMTYNAIKKSVTRNKIYAKTR